MNEKVVIYLDGEDKWRWRWWRGSDIIGDSGQGYVEKRDAINGIKAIARATDYQVTYESRRTENRRAYQQAQLTYADGHTLPVEIVPWQNEGRLPE